MRMLYVVSGGEEELIDLDEIVSARLSHSRTDLRISFRGGGDIVVLEGHLAMEAWKYLRNTITPCHTLTAMEPEEGETT